MTAQQTPVVRTIPLLPAEYQDQPVEWQRWELAPEFTHIDQSCDACDHEGSLSTAWGIVRFPEGWHRLFATRCRRCQQTRVSTRERFPDGLARATYGEWVEVAYFPPQAIGADL